MTDDLKKLSEEATALLPCPWCGGPAFPESPSYGRPKWTVVCDHCAAEGPRHNDESEAIAAWNTRATLAAPDADRGVQGFLNAIMEATPNGEWIAVQYHPNGDWSVAEKPAAPSREEIVAGVAGRAIAEVAALEAENKRLRARLEIGFLHDGEGNRVPDTEGVTEVYDGIECRNETIRQQDARIKRLFEELHFVRLWIERARNGETTPAEAVSVIANYPARTALTERTADDR